MKAIVLAAGLGTRLRPVTDFVPKPLVPFYGKPFLLYTLETLSSFTDEIVVVTHHREEMIRDAIGRQVDGVPVQYVHQPELLGTGDAILTATQHLSDRTLVVLGDVLVSPRLVRDMVSVDGDTVLSLAEVPDSENHLGVRVKGGAVIGLFIDSEWVDRGVYLLPPILLEYLMAGRAEGSELRLMRGVERMMASGHHVVACRSAEPWVQLGDHTGVDGVIGAMRYLRDLLAMDDPRGSVGTEVLNSVVEESVVFGPGRLRNSRIAESLVYVRDNVEDICCRGEIVVVG